MSSIYEKVTIVGEDGTPLLVNADGSIVVDGAGGGVVESIVAGTAITVDATDPANPEVSADVDTEVVYAEFTANVTISATSSGAANTVVTAPAFTADGSSSYQVEFYSPGATNGSGGSLVVELWLDGAALMIVGNPQTSALSFPVCVKTSKLVPAAGSRTYSIRAWRGGANGTIVAGNGSGGANAKGYIRVVKLAA